MQTHLSFNIKKGFIYLFIVAYHQSLKKKYCMFQNKSFLNLLLLNFRDSVYAFSAMVGTDNTQGLLFWK